MESTHCSMNDEGYIKFQAVWEQQPIQVSTAIVNQVNEIRNKLIERNWIGITPDGVGFGNISIRIKNTNQFLITGSATGGIKKLMAKNLAIVTEVNIQKNSLKCTGETIASSESMSHAIFYENLPSVNAVIHIHDSKIWNQYKNHLPTSDINAAYGTPEMAISIQKVITQKPKGTIIMGGHTNGIIAFGPNLSIAFNELHQTHTI